MSSAAAGSDTSRWDVLAGAVPPEVTRLGRAVSDGADGARERGQAARDALAEELRVLLGMVDPAPAVAHLGGLLLFRDEGPLEFVNRYGAEARLQYIAGLSVATTTRAGRAPEPHDIAAILRLTRDLFHLEKALLRAEDVAGEDPFIARARRQLRFEYLEDRFTNYARHQRVIARAVLPKIAAEFREEFGWAPEQLIIVADAALAIAQDRLTDMRRQARTLVDVKRLDDAANRALASFTGDMLPTLVTFGSGDLAAASGVDHEQVTRMLDALAPEWGEDIGVRLPLDENPLRWRNVLRAGDEWVLYAPYLLPQTCFETIGHLCATVPALHARWLTAQQRAAEDIVAARLRDLFPPERVHTNVALVAGPEQGESDVVVYLDDDALIIECKAAQLTPAGRRGAPRRVEKKARELLDTAFDQVERCRRHFAAPGGSFQPRGAGRRRWTIAPGAVLPGLVVTFERVDPLVMNSALRPAAGAAFPIGLGDFMSVCELLAKPSAVWTYICQRVGVAARPNVFAMSEADLLGAYLERSDFRPLLSMSPDVPVVVTYYAEVVNALLAVTPEDFRAPTLLWPPPLVLDALTRSLDRDCAGWSRATEAVHTCAPALWRHVKKVHRRGRSRPRVTTRVPLSPDVELVVGGDGGARVVRDGDRVELHVPHKS